METNSLVNRVEILFYSLLISVMSGINWLRAQVLPIPTEATQPAGEKVPECAALDEPARSPAHTIGWQSIQAVFAPLLLWAVLGFAAGFLLGMIKPW
jgi:hypothetical protein